MQAPLIAHVIHHFGMGGMENGLVNLINHMPQDRYRHAIVCLDGFTDFHKRIQRDNVQIYALGRRSGIDKGLYWRLWKLLRKIKPDIVHTRNLSTLEGQVIAAAAGVRARVHGEHGRDVFDLYGQNRKYNMLRKSVRPLVHRYVAVSQDLASWLNQTVGVAPEKVAQIYSGVDTERFHPRREARSAFGPEEFFRPDAFIVGSVGRMAEVKDYPTLVAAFVRAIEAEPAARERLRLVIIGEGVAREPCLKLLRDAQCDQLAWLPGERADIPDIMRNMDAFVLPSLGEGISNTILEAMSCGLPVVATAVGGNVELVQEGITGSLVPPGTPETMAQALLTYFRNPQKALAEGNAGRAVIEARFSLDAMIKGYLNVYDSVVRRPLAVSRIQKGIVE